MRTAPTGCSGQSLLVPLLLQTRGPGRRVQITEFPLLRVLALPKGRGCGTEAPAQLLARLCRDPGAGGSLRGMPRPQPVTPRGLHQHRCPRHSGSHGMPAALAVWHSQPSLWLLVALPGEGFWQEECGETEPEPRGCIAPNSPGPRNAGSALPGRVDAQGAPVFHQNPCQGGRENRVSFCGSS